MDAIVNLSGRDMRKILNIFESCKMCHDQITEPVVYACTGRPSVQDIDIIFTGLLNSSNFKENLKCKIIIFIYA